MGVDTGGCPLGGGGSGHGGRALDRGEGAAQASLELSRVCPQGRQRHSPTWVAPQRSCEAWIEAGWFTNLSPYLQLTT